jgi:hypothetical protein
MKNQKPSQYSNYITIKDVLHPESLYATEQTPSAGTAEFPVVVIDEPSHPTVGANKWNVVWAEATLLNDESIETDEVKIDSNTAHVTAPATPTAAPAASAPTISLLDAPYHHSGLIESAVGLPLTFAAVVATALTEVGALIVYATAVVIYGIALPCKTADCGIFTFIPRLLYLIFGLTKKVLMLCDFIILICSVIISETIAFTCWILNSIFSCCRCGMPWHQYIRRVCHVTRWAFRDFHRHWEPQRVFPFGRPPKPSSQPPTGVENPPPSVTPTAPVDPEITVEPYDATKPNPSNDIDIKV